MKKIKIFCLTIFLGLATQTTLYAQDIFWLESAFDSPKLTKTAADGSELLSKSLMVGSQPQSLISDGPGDKLLWSSLSFSNAQINSISEDFIATNAIVDSHTTIRGMALDRSDQKIYWISTNLVEGVKIQRADMNGQGVEVLIDFGIGSNNTLRSIGLDSDAGKMYWTNFGAGKIQRADMNFNAVPEDILAGLKGPAGLFVDTDSMKIYWTEMNGGQVKSADMNGDNIRLLVDGLANPGFISVNNKHKRMAWSELGTESIKSADLDGSNIFDYGISATAPTGLLIDSPRDSVFTGTGQFKVSPADTTIEVQQYVQYKAQLIDSNGVAFDTTASWYLKGDRVGPVSSHGLVFAYFPGKSVIVAKQDTNYARAHLTVVDSAKDSSGVNFVKIIRKFPNDKEKHAKIIKEGQSYTLGGIKHPYNILNGAKLYFPMGSLVEDITIEITIPKMSRVKNDSLSFANRIINGIRFDVFVADSLSEPYYFEKPVSVSIPFKRGIIKKLGINPARLGLFFALDSTTFDSLGISKVLVDSSQNRIYGLVEHFSTLVIRERQVTTDLKNSVNIDFKPEKYSLYQNYPNPFNPKTTISYTLPVAAKAELTVYNMLGEKVATLFSGKQQPGIYKVNWDATLFASGVYFYRLETDQGYKQVRKMILIK